MTNAKDIAKLPKTMKTSPYSFFLSFQSSRRICPSTDLTSALFEKAKQHRKRTPSYSILGPFGTVEAHGSISSCVKVGELTSKF